MNRKYYPVWGKIKRIWVTVTDMAASGWFSRPLVAMAIILACMATGAGSAHAVEPGELPTGGYVTNGQANISQTSSTMTIDQQTDKMTAEWDTFNIGQDASVEFRQPGTSSVALNRIYDQNPSQIFGRLSSNGQVFLLNPSGVYFGPTAQVDVGGMVASSLKISDEDFLKEKYNFESSGDAGTIINDGNIRALNGGYLAFIAPEIKNSGIISADKGSALFAAGDRVNLDFTGDGLVTFTVDQGAIDAQIENKGLIQTTDGMVMMTAKAADDLIGSVINNTGIIEAKGVTEQGGRILLFADGGQSTISGALDASSDAGAGGNVTVTGDRVLVESGAHLTASGATGGGDVLVGGNWQGSDPTIHQAEGAVIEQGALLEANATDKGDGGTVVAWSDVQNPNSVTRAYGTFEAKGGPNGGNGGRIETSGHWMDVGMAPDMSAPAGNGGLWLIDPYNITVVAGSGNTNINAGSPFLSSGDSASLGVELVNTALGSGNVTIQTGSGGTQAGDITWNTAYTYVGGTARSLTLQAHRDILLNYSIESTGGALGMTFTANSDGLGSGGTVVKGDLTTNGGDLTFNGTGAIFSGSSAQTLSTSNGAINFNGETIIANTNGLTLNSGNGNIVFASRIDSGNTYIYDNTARTWNNAYTAAGGAGSGVTGSTYLATVTSALEMSSVMAAAGGSQAWLGGSDAATEGVWRWVTGPEGLESEAGGTGRIFWTTSQATGATGYNGYNSRYVNWNTGEPNDSGSNEDALQLGAGLTGQWNDLPNASSTLGSIVETNLAASPLTINSGTVTFDGAVGSNKALSSLTVTAATTAINGGAVTTEGVQTYNTDMTVGSASTTLTQINSYTDFTIQNGYTLSNAHSSSATVTMNTTRDINVNGIISSSTNPLNMVFNADSERNDDGAIIISKDIATHGGYIKFGGDSSYEVGTVLSGSVTRSISTSGGAVDFYGDVMAVVDTDITTAGGNVTFHNKLDAGNSYTLSGTSTFNWSQAVDDADNVANSYLITITSALENSLARSVANGNDVWTGAYRGADNYWRWMTGPEALLEGGDGLAFSIGASSASSVPGTYSNWTSDEPNASGLAMQIWYNGGVAKWDDTGATTAKYYIRETAGDAAVFSVDAGAGAVTFTGSVGETSALGSLSVTSTAVSDGINIDGGTVTTEGVQAYTGSVTLGAMATTLTQTDADTNFTLTTGTSITNDFGNDASLTIKTTGSIIMDPNSSISSSTGKLDAVLWSDTDANGGGVWMKPGSSISSNSGNVTVAGGLDDGSNGGSSADGIPDGFSTGRDGVANHTDGIWFQNATINSGGGDVTIRGKGATTGNVNNTLGFQSNMGVLGASSSGDAFNLNSGSGKINIHGVSRETNGINAQGISWISGKITSANTASDAITIVGDASLTNNTGWAMGADLRGTIQTTASGGISITGIGGTTTGALSTQAHGLVLWGSGNVLSNSGAITLTGTVGSTINSSVDIYQPGYLGYKSGTDVIASSSNIRLNANTMTLAGTDRLQSSGTLTIQPRTANTTIGIAGGAGTLSLPASYFTTNFSDGFSSITIGSATAGAITVGAATTFNDNVTLLNNSTIVINGAVTANENLTLTSNGAITQSAALDVTGTTNITAGEANEITLSNTSNDFTGAVSVVSGNDIDIVDSNTMTLGAVNSTGTVDVATLTGDLTLTGAIETTDTTDTAIVLNAGKNTAAGTSTGGNIIVSGGSVTTGAGGRASLYSGDVSDSAGLTALIGSGSGKFRYNSDESASNFTTTLSAGKYAIYRAQPIITVTPSSGQSVTYGSGPGSVYSLSGYLNGDSSTSTSGAVTWTVSGTTSTAGYITAGIHDISYNTGLTNSLGYGFADNAGSADELTVTQRSITVTGLTVSDKTYDSTNTASLGGTAAISVLGADVVTLGGTPAGTFADKNVGTGKAVTVTGNTISGTDSGNYTLAQQTGLTADITQRAISISGIIAANKVYDATTSATVDTTGAAGWLAGDTVTVSASGLFDNKNVGTGKTVTLTSSYGGADLGNYSITDQASTTANITQRAINISGITAANKDYNANTTATVDTTGAAGWLAGDTVTVSASGLFDNKNVGTGKTVDLTSSYSGADADNYSITDQATTNANITQRAITISGITAANKVYDANTTATVDTTGAEGWLTGDTVTVSASGLFDNKNVGTGKTVTLTSSYAGDDASNYSITDQVTTTANITQRPITISGITAANKVYDANTTATLDTTGAAGWLAGDTVTVSASGLFDNKNVGTGKTVTLTSSYAGDDASNYSITDQVTTTANITQRPITISGIAATNKVYDANTTATVDTTGVTGWISGDTVTVSSSGEFDNKNVGTGKTVTLTSSYGGADSGNYSITDQASTTANITQRPITISGIAATNKVYDANTTATVDTTGVTGWISGDTVTVTSSGEFDNKNVGTGKTVTLTSSYGGADSGNYSITDQASTTANITQRAITISGITAANKVYDANDTATVYTTAAGGWLAGDTVTVSSSGLFDNKNVGTGKTVNLTSSYGGADLGNYLITNQASTTANITQKALTASYTGINKVYDGTTNAQVTASSADIIAGDIINFSQNAHFTNKDAGIGKNINVTNIDLLGIDSANYNLQNITATATANITPALLTVTASDDTRIFNNVQYSGGNGVTYAGFANNETSSVLNGTLEYGGTSQGAVNPGLYDIVPFGLTSNNYDINFISGLLEIISDTNVTIDMISRDRQNGINSTGQDQATQSGGSFTSLLGPGSGSSVMTGYASFEVMALDITETGALSLSSESGTTMVNFTPTREGGSIMNSGGASSGEMKTIIDSLPVFEQNGLSGPVWIKSYTISKGNQALSAAPFNGTEMETPPGYGMPEKEYPFTLTMQDGMSVQYTAGITDEGYMVISFSSSPGGVDIEKILLMGMTVVEKETKKKADEIRGVVIIKRNRSI